MSLPSLARRGSDRALPTRRLPQALTSRPALAIAVTYLALITVAELVTSFTAFAGQVVLGLIVFAIGLFLANLAAKTIKASGAQQAGLLALAARVSILALSGAMALREMGLANEIINLAFGLLLGAVAVAAALAFGLGGRETASRELEAWVKAAKSKDS